MSEKNKSNLSERVWMRISVKNKKKLDNQAEKNQRNKSQEMNSILDQYFDSLN